MKTVELTKVPYGTCFSLADGGRKFVSLGAFEGEWNKIAVTSLHSVRDMQFGVSNDYIESAVRRYLNEEFYNELCADAGGLNIEKRSVSLLAEDGTNRGVECEDYVSLMTIDRYREYRPYIPNLDNWWWTATPFSKEERYARDVCCVDSLGVVRWDGCRWSGHVRPFFVLNSFLSVWVDE